VKRSRLFLGFRLGQNFIQKFLNFEFGLQLLNLGIIFISSIIVGKLWLLFDFEVQSLLHQTFLSGIAISPFLSLQTDQRIKEGIIFSKLVFFFSHQSAKSLNLLSPWLKMNSYLNAYIGFRKIDWCISHSAHKNGFNFFLSELIKPKLSFERRNLSIQNRLSKGTCIDFKNRGSLAENNDLITSILVNFD
jgi:hypothetical protein